MQSKLLLPKYLVSLPKESSLVGKPVKVIVLPGKSAIFIRLITSHNPASIRCSEEPDGAALSVQLCSGG